MTNRDRLRTIDVVVPLYNEAGNVALLVERLASTLAGRQWRLVAVDDGSADDTVDEVEAALRKHSLDGRVVRLSRNFGLQAALQAGIAACGKGRTVAVLDGDLQDPPELLLSLLAPIESGEADVAVGVKTSRADSSVRRVLFWTFHRIMGALTGGLHRGGTGNLCVLAPAAVDAIAQLTERVRYFPHLRDYAGFRVVEVHYTKADRANGTSRQSLRRLLRLAVDATLSSSFVPLQLAMVLGLGLAGLAVVGGIAALVCRFLLQLQIPGIFTLAALIMLIGGLAIATNGMVGLYVGRIFTEVKARPAYYVAETNDVAPGSVAPGLDREDGDLAERELDLTGT